MQASNGPRILLRPDHLNEARLLLAFGNEEHGNLAVRPITREAGMMMYKAGMDPQLGNGRRGPKDDLAVQIEGHIERKASGRIRDLHVVCSGESIILQGRSRTYHAKQLAQQAALDLTEGCPSLTNQIVVC